MFMVQCDPSFAPAKREPRPVGVIRGRDDNSRFMVGLVAMASFVDEKELEGSSIYLTLIRDANLPRISNVLFSLSYWTCI